MEGHLKPLHIPFEETRINTVKLLLANGCTLETENSQGRTPLESALDNGLPRNTAYLLDAGASSSGEDVWETLRGSYPITLCDGSGLATFVALVNRHKEKDPSFVVSAIFWLLGQEHAVNSNRQIFGESIRWLVAKEANRPLMNETVFRKACIVAAFRDMESLDILTRSQLRPSHELEQLIEPTSVRRDETLMMAFLDLNRQPWQDLSPSALYSWFSFLLEVDGYIAADKLATEDYARDWIPSISLERLRHLLRSVLGIENYSLVPVNPRGLGFYTAVRHRLVQVLCEAGAGTFAGSSPRTIIQRV